MPEKNLCYKVIIEFDGEQLASATMEGTEKILSLKREREFQMNHFISTLAGKAVQKAITEYDKRNETTNNK